MRLLGRLVRRAAVAFDLRCALCSAAAPEAAQILAPTPPCGRLAAATAASRRSATMLATTGCSMMLLGAGGRCRPPGLLAGGLQQQQQRRRWHAARSLLPAAAQVAAQAAASRRGVPGPPRRRSDQPPPQQPPPPPQQQQQPQAPAPQALVQQQQQLPPPPPQPQQQSAPPPPQQQPKQRRKSTMTTQRSAPSAAAKLSQEAVNARVDEFIASLSEEQRAAALHPGARVRVIAGPGSGKTRVVAARLAHLLRGGARPGSLVGITFTNKAADELKGRLVELLGARRARALRVGTFHSLAARLLRDNAESLGVGDFPIYDESAARGALKRALQRHGGAAPPAAAELDADIRLISRLKNATAHAMDLVPAPSGGGGGGGGLSRLPAREVTGALERAGGGDEGGGSGGLQLDRLGPALRARLERRYDEYSAQLAAEGALDYDDLLHAAVAALRGDALLRARLHERIAHVVVDESQDTNAAQAALLRLLAGAPGAALYAVGDPNQCIYGFRGSDPRLVTGGGDVSGAFGGSAYGANNGGGVATVSLRDNYRSRPHIVRAGEALLRGTHPPPELYFGANAVRGGGDRPAAAPQAAVNFWSAAHQFEMRQLAGAVVAHAAGRHASLSDIAVLARRHAELDPVARELERLGLPYKRAGARNLWSAAEVSASLKLLRLAAAPGDADACAAVLESGLPVAQGLGKASLQQVQDVAAQRGVSVAALMLGQGWGTAAEARAPAAAAARVAEAANALPGRPAARARMERLASADAADSREEADWLRERAAAEVAAEQKDDQAALERFWDELASDTTAYAPPPPEEPLASLLSGRQAKAIARAAARLRALVAALRAVAANAPPDAVLAVAERASGLHLLVESLAAAAAARARKGGGKAKPKSGGDGGGGGGDDGGDSANHDDTRGDGADARAARRFENLDELRKRAGAPKIYSRTAQGLLTDDDDDGSDEGEDEQQQPPGAPSGLEALRAFVDYAALAAEEDDGEGATPKVQLLTVHASKGLEFGAVLLVHEHNDRDDASDAERAQEKNIVYTALTRARDELHLFARRGELEFAPGAGWVPRMDKAGHAFRPFVPEGNAHVAHLLGAAKRGRLEGAQVHEPPAGCSDLDEFVRERMRDDERNARRPAARSSNGSSNGSSGAAGLVASTNGQARRGGRRASAAQGAVRRRGADGSSGSGDGDGGSDGDDGSGLELPGWLGGSSGANGGGLVASGKRLTPAAVRRKGRPPPPPPEAQRG